MRVPWVLSVFFFCTPAYGHDWYPGHCCKNHDCAPVACDDIKETATGYAFREFHFRGWQVEISRDSKCHACIGMSLRARERLPRCLFIQPTS